jgi:hypothetical protein
MDNNFKVDFERNVFGLNSTIPVYGPVAKSCKQSSITSVDYEYIKQGEFPEQTSDCYILHPFHKA